MRTTRRLVQIAAALSVVIIVVPMMSVVADARATPDTLIDSRPPSVTAASGATFTFHSTLAPASYTCKLDSAPAAACANPANLTGLSEGHHTFTVFATVAGVADRSPATAAWTVDKTSPAPPTGLKASAGSATSVSLSWAAAIDDVGVSSYDVLRNGTLLSTLGAVTAYGDRSASPGTSATYAIRARDVAGNTSAVAAVTVTTPTALDARLTRAPYLTDLVGLHAIVNFATDRSNSSATVRYGPASGGTCSLTTTVAASRVTVSVNGVFEYQWKAPLTLPTVGSYCYRPYLGTVDLLAANVSPQFASQVPAGSNESYSFAVFGDWGQVDATGVNAMQANLMSQIAASGSRFAITTGDNAYPGGSQGNYGDLQQVGPSTGGVFGPSGWAPVGGSLPIFPAVGNHGLARSDAVHPQFANWPEDVAVATSSGRYQSDTYCCPNGSASATYASAWYAFDAGAARFYVLDAAWADANVGTASAYANEAAAHWSPTSPEYQWLQADLAAHPSGLKFAFFHYPLYADQPDEHSDTFLQGNNSLEGLLATNGVNLAFSGHAHIYQRSAGNTDPGRQSLPSYVTGGGGAKSQSTGACSANDRYAIGWSYTHSRGTRCGTATAPTGPDQVLHFLKVTISGSTVTVTPTDSTGHTFDVQTYTFAPKPDTYIDTSPPAGSSGTSATFTFHATPPTATFTCTLDGGAPAPCTSPATISGLGSGSHTFTVAATAGGATDPVPATVTWTVDGSPPTAPTNFTAVATSPFSVSLAWTAATDDIGLAGYDVLRDGALLATIPPSTTYIDAAVLAESSHVYAVRARDTGGNVSPFTPSLVVVTGPPPVPVFADGFESGSLGSWTSTSGLAVESTTVSRGTFAAEGNTVNGSTYAKETLPSTYADAYARVWYDLVAGPDQVNLLRLRDTTGTSIGYVYLATDGQLGYHNDTTGTNTLSGVVPGPGWHAVELHVAVGGPTGQVDVWLDNIRLAGLSTTTDTGVNPVGQLQIGEVQAGRTYDVVFDDAAFATSRLGPNGDVTAPSAPADLTVVPTSAFSLSLNWSASTDNVGVTGYDLSRDGTPLASLGPVTAFIDTTVLPGTTHSYSVRARDAAGNVSAPTTMSATTPAAATPIFANGFESGTLSGWTSTGGLVVESTDVHSGTFAAEGNTTNGATYAKKTLPSTYPSGYGRVAFEVKTQAAQINLLRMRDTAGTSIGYLYLTSSGQLAFHNDTTGANTVSTLVPGPAWHSVELHLVVNGASSVVEVWLDGVPVVALSGAATLGSTPIGSFQVGETQTGRTYDVVLDDAAFSDQRIGP